MSGRSGLVPPTNNSALGIASVGGARGTGAALIQVLANFAVQYDRGRLEQITRDLKKVQDELNANQRNQNAFTEKQRELESSVLKLDQARMQLARTNAQQAKDTLALLTSQQKLQEVGLDLTRSEQAALNQNLAAMERQGVISAEQVQLLNMERSARLELAKNALNQNAAIAEGNALEAQRLALLREQQTAQAATGSAIGRVGALGLGLIGGAVGGAIVGGLALEPIQQLINKVSEGLQDIVDPARQAREAIGDIRSEIDELTDDGRLTRLEAAAEYLERIGAASAGSDVDAGKLGLSAAIDKFIEDLGKIQEADTASEATAQRMAEAVRSQAQVLLDAVVAGRDFAAVLAEIRASGDLAANDLSNLNAALGGNVSSLEMLAARGSVWAQNLLAQANAMAQAGVQANVLGTDLEALGGTLQDTLNYIQELNQATIDVAVSKHFDARLAELESSHAATVERINAQTEAAISGINSRYERTVDGIRSRADNQIDALQKRISNLNSGPSGRTRALEERLEALKDAEPSKRTNELAAAIERLNRAQDKQAFQAQLAAINQERSLILLRERLRTTERQINLDNYQGKERLAAIEALLDRQREQNEAQDRFNKLLEIQYNIGRGVRRQQGETIQDFISRRAQYYRGLLQQAAELRREGPQADLEAERDRVATSIQLKELEERRRKIIEDRARQQRLQSLQEQLAASRKRDQDELESRRESLQRQLEASRNADQAALASARARLQERIEAIRENSQQQIKEADRVRDRSIAATQTQRDAAIKAAEDVLRIATAALERQAEQVKKWTNFANIQSLNTAIEGAQNMAQLQALSGELSGLAWTLNYLRQTGAWMGMDINARNALISSFGQALHSYSRKVISMHRGVQKPSTPVMPSSSGRPSAGGYAQGGVFWADNTNTPVGRDIRWGDSNGKELGVILSNAVVRKLGESRGEGPLVGSVTFQSEDPYRDQARFERRMRSIVRDEMRN